MGIKYAHLVVCNAMSFLNGVGLKASEKLKNDEYNKWHGLYKSISYLLISTKMSIEKCVNDELYNGNEICSQLKCLISEIDYITHNSFSCKELYVVKEMLTDINRIFEVKNEKV